ncbi:MAG: hypothetical protein ACYDAJ_03165 [Nitrosotalea sp.]
MARWKKDEKEFGVKLTFDGRNSMVCRIPKPILDLLGNPEGLKFSIKGKTIVVMSEEKK